MRIVFMGTPEFAVRQLTELLSAGHDIPLVVTQPDRPAGRGRKIVQSAVERTALQAGLPVIAPANVNDPAVIAQVAAIQADLAVVAAFGQKLSQNLLDVPRLGFYNVHASLLPKYRGAAPINRALINGDPVTGVTVQTVVFQMDAGAIADQREVRIDPRWNAADLTVALADVGAKLLVDVLARLEAGSLQLRPQSPQGVTRAPRLNKSDGIIDWSKSAHDVHNLVRGVTPWPGAQTFRQDSAGHNLRLLLVETTPLDLESVPARPGEVVAAGDAGIDVACGRGVLRVLRLKPAGKREMTAGEFAHGHHWRPGDTLAATP